jgi:hypothetical protein
MTDWIPGIEDQLGWGFNIFGNYFPTVRNGSAKLQTRLIDATTVGSPEDVTVNNKIYKKPEDVVVGTGHGFNGQSSVFSSKTKVVEHWQEEAEVQGSYGAFSGGFKESFQSSSQEENEVNYCLYEANSLVYSLQLANPSSTMISQEVLNDPDYSQMLNLLKQGIGINDTNQSIYFKFFQKYGTHIITSVSMGGYLNYYASASKSYAKTDQQFEAQINAEYGALFKASGSGSWNNVSEQWMEDRQAAIIGYGGDPSSPLVSDILANWTTNTDYSKDFAAWVSSIPSNPSPIGFSLYPVASLFSGQESDLLYNAYLAYASALMSIRISATPAQISVIWNGNTLAVPEPGTSNLTGGFWVVIDRQTKEYKIVAQGNDYSQVPDEVMNQKNKTPSPLVLVCLPLGTTGVGWGGGPEPTGNLVNFLRLCGAGDALDTVLAWPGWGETIYANGYYCLIGVIGSGPETGQEVETLSPMVPSIEWNVPIIPIWDGEQVLYSPPDW